MNERANKVSVECYRNEQQMNKTFTKWDLSCSFSVPDERLAVSITRRIRTTADRIYANNMGL